MTANMHEHLDTRPKDRKRVRRAERRQVIADKRRFAAWN